MCASFTEDDVGKTVVNASGDEVGIVSAVEHGTAHVEPDPGVTDTIKAKLGWGSADEDAYPLQEGSVDHVTDDHVHLKSDLAETGGVDAGTAGGTGAGGDTGITDDSGVHDDDDSLIGDDDSGMRDDDDSLIGDDDDDLIGDDDSGMRDDDDSLIGDDDSRRGDDDSLIGDDDSGMRDDDDGLLDDDDDGLLDDDDDDGLLDDDDDRDDRDRKR